jgi:predicted transcriptional regulator
MEKILKLWGSTEYMFDFEYRPQRGGMEKVLGAMEGAIMEVMWKKNRATAKEVYEALKKGKRSSISILLQRLCEKGLLSREEEVAKGGKRYIYSVEVDKTTFERHVVKTVIDSLMETFEDCAKEYLQEI